MRYIGMLILLVALSGCGPSLSQWVDMCRERYAADPEARAACFQATVARFHPPAVIAY